MPNYFEGQAELIWTHLERILTEANMSIADLVSLRFYLAEAAHDPANVAVLQRHLGDHHAARTVVCAGLLEPDWLVEIEAIAAALSMGDLVQLFARRSAPIPTLMAATTTARVA